MVNSLRRSVIQIEIIEDKITGFYKHLRKYISLKRTKENLIPQNKSLSQMLGCTKLAVQIESYVINSVE